MVRKKLKEDPEAFCTHLLGLLEKNDTVQFANDFLSGIMGKHRVPIGTILQKTGVGIDYLAECLAQAGIGLRKIQRDCPDFDAYKSGLVAALHRFLLKSSISSSQETRSGRRGMQGQIYPIMPPRNEARRPYVLSMAFRNEVAHSLNYRRF